MIYDKSAIDRNKLLSNIYIKNLKNNKILSDEQQRNLVKAWKETGDIDVRNRLLVSNLRLVVNRALAHLSSKFPLTELISEGNLGLIKAIDNFDVSKKTKFTSHAYSWIDAYIKYFIKEYNRTPMHIPHNIINEKAKKKKEKELFFKETGHDDTPVKNIKYKKYKRIKDDNVEEAETQDINESILRLKEEITKLNKKDQYIIIEAFKLDMKKPEITEEEKNITYEMKKVRIKEITEHLKTRLNDIDY